MITIIDVSRKQLGDSPLSQRAAIAKVAINYIRIRVRTASPVSVRVRTRVSVSISYTVLHESCGLLR